MSMSMSMPVGNTIIQTGGPASAASPEAPPGAPKDGSKDGSSRAVAPEPGFILLVDDDFVLRSSLAAVLHVEGYRVECAANALDALRRLERPPKPSLILLDIMLPYMDGLEFRALQRNMREIADIPVIVITAVGVRPEIAQDLDLRQAFSKPIKRHCPPSVS
jgi:CheY-like chemotaxis protein